MGKANMIEAYIWKTRPSQNLKNSTIFKVESKLRMFEVMTYKNNRMLHDWIIVNHSIWNWKGSEQKIYKKRMIYDHTTYKH
jgi:hypothetical protein